MQMPAEVGVATTSVGAEGAERAAHFAVAALASRRRGLRSPEGSSKVAVLAESARSLEALQPAKDHLEKLGVHHQMLAIGAGETPELARQLADLERNGTAVFIAGSGQGFGFACEVAKATTLPVLGVPIVTEHVRCVDHFLQQFLHMPPGLATFAVGRPGAINAALFAATILSGPGTDVWEKLRRMRDEQVARVRAMTIESDLGKSP